MQLDLFTDWLAGQTATKSASVPVVSTDRQLDLFEERRLDTGSALQALRDLELDQACQELAVLGRRYPRDQQVISCLTLANRLRDAYRRALEDTQEPLRAWAALEQELVPQLMSAWHRHMAREAERQSSAGRPVGNVLAGYHWLSVGDAARAEASLRATLARAPRLGQARGYLADALYVQGERERARREYARVLAEQPRAVDWGRLVDPEVRGLPEIARLELELPGDGRDWAAALGMIRGVFALPDLLLPGLGEADVATQSEAGLAFLQALRQERRARSLDERVNARRTMKRLCPALFAEYLGSI